MTFQPNTFRLVAADHMQPLPPLLDPDASCREAVEALARSDASCLFAVTAAGTIAGILTEQDIARRIAFQISPDTPIASVMSKPIRTIEGGDYLYRAVSTMRRQDIRHLPVVDRTGRAIGLLDLGEATAVLAGSVMDQIDRLAVAGSIEEIRSVKAAQVQLAAELFQQEVTAPEIQQMLTDINLDIYRRVVEANLAAMAETGWGSAPVGFCVLLMGSGGRGENFLYPDQDNGFIVEDYPDADHSAIDPWFIELALRMTRDLDAIGFPYCPGGVMATNPLWRKTRSQWQQQVSGWTRKRSFVTARLVAIFLDFRSAFGRRCLSDALRAHVTPTLAEAPILLNELYESEAEHGTALGWFNRVRVESGRDGHRGKVNMKLNGLLPLVEGVRLLAVKNRIPETRTLVRIARLVDAGVIKRDDGEYLESAFVHLTHLLMRQQIAEFQAGHAVGSYLDPTRLSKRERELLISSFHSIESLRARIRQEFSLEPL